MLNKIFYSFFYYYRKGGLFANNIVSSLACILMFISKPIYSYEVLIVGRFFLGLSCGNNYSISSLKI